MAPTYTDVSASECVSVCHPSCPLSPRRSVHTLRSYRSDSACRDRTISERLAWTFRKFHRVRRYICYTEDFRGMKRGAFVSYAWHLLTSDDILMNITIEN